MSLPVTIVMPGDGAANPFTIPGTTRRYSCSAGSAIQVPGEDAQALLSQGWVGLASRGNIRGCGPTSGRPTVANAIKAGEVYLDTTVGIVVLYGGLRTQWLNPMTGAVV